MTTPKQPNLQVISGGMDSPATASPTGEATQHKHENLKFSSSSVDDTRKELIQALKGDIEKLMAADEDGVREIYANLVSYDEDAKLYLGARPMYSSGEGKYYLGWPNYRKILMREAILNLFQEKIRKIEK